MEVRLYKPQNALISKYVECIYTLKRTSVEESVTYMSCPSVFPIVCLNANASVVTSGNNLTISHGPNETVEASLIVDFGNPGLVRYEGAVDEIVVYFKPLGLNAFLEHDLRSYVQKSFTPFAPFADFQKAMTEIFTYKEDPERISALENYWVAKLKGFRHTFLSSVVDDLMKDRLSEKISDLSHRQNISRPTLNEQFDRHLCTTPSQFRKVVRFRKAIEQNRNKHRADNLSLLSRKAKYFDHSHMIKDFKSLTGYPPKKFFSKITELEKGQLIWMFCSQ